MTNEFGRVVYISTHIMDNLVDFEPENERICKIWVKLKYYNLTLISEWKETIIVPIHKRGDRDKCENYRGIALGNAAYKILSNIILEKIKPYIEEITGDYQNGFREGRSVIDNIFALKILKRENLRV